MGFNACWWFTLRASLLILLVFSCTVYAHETPEQRLKNLDSQLGQLPLKNSSESIELMLKRADLNRRQKAWDAALLDYQRVAEQEPDNTLQLLGRSQLYLDKKNYSKAMFWATRVLRLDLNHVQANLHYARALGGIGAHDAALVVFDRAIRQHNKVKPEHYIEQAKSLLLKSDPDAMHLAVSILDEGISVLGELISLHSLALELELQAGLLDAALRRVDIVLANNASLLTWRLQRSELLLLVERQSVAMDELRCIMHRIEQLPQQRRNSRAVQSLMERSRALAETLSTLEVHHVNVMQYCD